MKTHTEYGRRRGACTGGTPGGGTRKEKNHPTRQHANLYRISPRQLEGSVTSVEV